MVEDGVRVGVSSASGTTSGSAPSSAPGSWELHGQMIGRRDVEHVSWTERTWSRSRIPDPLVVHLIFLKLLLLLLLHHRGWAAVHGTTPAFVGGRIGLGLTLKRWSTPSVGPGDEWRRQSVHWSRSWTPHVGIVHRWTANVELARPKKNFSKL